ncbi:glycosyltransferase family 4 protein [candidate division KSB1 bacterium]|nr:glycosyltransferase family 4 protein [candidate division KSB1 bacterium]
MKILQTARWFFPHTGGGTIRVYNIARNLVKLGHEVHLLVHHPDSIEQCNVNHSDEKIKLQEEYDGIRVYRLPYYPPNFLYWSISIPLMTRKAYQIIREQKIDVVLSDNPPYLVGTASFLASRMASIPMVINVHDVWGATHYTSIQYKVGASLEQFCTRKIGHFVTVSEGLRTVLSDSFQIPLENIGVAANAIDLSRFNINETQVAQTLACYPQFHLKKSEKYVVFVGIMRQWAGVQYLIEAFAKVIQAHPELKLLLVGGGGDKEWFMELAQKFQIMDHIIFTDALPYIDIPAFISLATITCAPFPSTRVTDQKQLMSPLKVLEYMAAGKAVIASHVGGMENYITDHQTGLMVPPGDVEALANKISYLIERPDLIKTLGENARTFVQDEKFGWLASAKVVENMLLESQNHFYKNNLETRSK